VKTRITKTELMGEEEEREGEGGIK
jgi:hypothetical protein